MCVYIYIYIMCAYMYIYSISIIHIVISSNSCISMVTVIPCLCDLHGLLHVCMRVACVYEQLYE